MAEVDVIAVAAMRNDMRDTTTLSPSYAKLLTQLFWCLALEHRLLRCDGTDPATDRLIRSAEIAWTHCHATAQAVASTPIPTRRDKVLALCAALIGRMIAGRDLPDPVDRHFALASALAAIFRAARNEPGPIRRMLSHTGCALQRIAALDGVTIPRPDDPSPAPFVASPCGGLCAGRLQSQPDEGAFLSAA